MEIFGWLINSIIGTIIAGILYPLLITAPLQILNGIYQAFSFCAGASIGEIFFNTAGQSLVFNVNAPLFKYLIGAIIISLILMVVFIIALTIEHLVTKKKVNMVSKIKWPLLAITSTITVPLAFVLLSTFSSALMSLIGGTTTKTIILTENVNDIFSNMRDGINQLCKDMNIVLPDGTISCETSLTNALQAIRDAITNISQEATKSGMTDIAERCRIVNQNLDAMISLANNWDNEIIKDFNDVMNYIVNPTNWVNGAVKVDSGTSTIMNRVIVKLMNFQTNWNSVIENANSIFKDAKSYLPSVITNTIKIYDISGLPHDITIETILGTIKGDWTNTIWGSFNSLWVDNKDNKSLFTIMMQGGKWHDLVFDVNKQCYLNFVACGIDPQTQNTYSLVVQIYQLVTGNNDNNWMGWWNMSKGVSLINVGVGFIIIAGSIFVTGLFGLMAARRLVELAVLAVFSIVAAMAGIKDDGAKFNNSIKLIVAKMFSIVIGWASFSIGLALMNSINDLIANATGLDHKSLAYGVIQAMVMVGGLLGAYHIAIMLQQWMGDSTSLAGTLADIGAMKSMMGAGVIVGGIALGGKLLSKGGKAAVAKRSATKTNKMMNFAQSKGLGKIQYSIGAKGKAVVSGFKFNPKMQNAAQEYSKLMKSEEFKKFKMPKGGI